MHQTQTQTLSNFDVVNTLPVNHFTLERCHNLATAKHYLAKYRSEYPKIKDSIKIRDNSSGLFLKL